MKKGKRFYKIAAMDLEAGRFDSESGLGADEVDLWGIYIGGKYYHFRYASEFVDFIFDNLKQFHKTFIYAHNGGGYDFLYLIRYLRDSEYWSNVKLKMELNGKIVAFRLFNSRYWVEFRDSFKLLPSSLKKLGKSFGFPKTEMPSWNENRNKMSYEEHYKQMIEYNKNDNVILVNIIRKFLSEIGWDWRVRAPPYTAPSLSFRLWKNMMGIKMASELTDVYSLDKVVRESYVGGRTEVFKTHTDDEYIYVDVNSLYPSEMYKNEFPIGKSEYLKGCDCKKAFEMGMPGVYFVDWKVDKNLHTPVLWTRKVINGSTKLVFPVNRDNGFRGRGAYTYPELELAVRSGYYDITKFKKCVVMSETAPIFREFVDKFIKMKYQGGAKKEVAKIILNSLYGKTGQKPFARTMVQLSPSEAHERLVKYATLNDKLREVEDLLLADGMDPMKFKIYRELKYLVEMNKIYSVDENLGWYTIQKPRFRRDIVVMWASYVSSLARRTLWESMRLAEFEQAYCDTDSMIIPKEYAKYLDIDSKRLGAWKIEGHVYRGRYYAPKTYVLEMDDGIYFKAKGLNQTARKVVDGKTFDEVVRLLEKRMAFETRAIVQYKQAMKMGVAPGTNRIFVKQFSLNYDKRKVLENGRTIPL